jgi:hypothetical protein
MNISDLRQEISILREERLKAENRLMQAKEMFPCSLILRKVICGNPNCRCQKGKLHGPYPYLSGKVKGKTRLTYVRKKDFEKVEKKTEEYRLFQKRLEYVRHLNRRIDDLFKRIREMKIEVSKRMKTKENRKK